MFNLGNSRLLQYLPKVILPAILSSFRMVFLTFIIGLIVGGTLGILIVLTKPDGLYPNKYIHGLIDFIANTIRSFPTLILIVALIPFTKLIIGTSIGERAAIFPMTIATIPYAIRLVETSLNSVDQQLIIAAKSFGASNFQIVTKVMLVEARSILISNFTMLAISVLGTVTIAGAVGGGGLGAVALTYGYQRFDDLVMYTIVFILLVLVFILQALGNYFYKKSL